MRPWLGVEEQEAAAEAIASGWVAQGPRVAAFERAYATRVGARHGVAVSSCTAGLHLALHALGLRPGDEVVVPSLSFIATANVVRHAGATPVFADVDLATLNLTPGTVDRVVTPRTRAVVVVHQAGAPADVGALGRLLQPRRIAVVEDAACAVGSTWHGRPVGADARVAAFSFHPRKMITTGEGGMVVTPDGDLAARLRRLREHGMSVSAAERHGAGGAVLEEYVETAFNYRMTDVQAAIGLVQLGRLDDIVARRRMLAARYATALSGVEGLRLTRDPEGGTSNFQSYWALLPPDLRGHRDEVLRRLAEHGVSARRGIMAAHLEPAYRDVPAAALPTTEVVTRGSLILPMFHEMTTAQQDRVVAVLLDVVDDLRGS